MMNSATSPLSTEELELHARPDTAAGLGALSTVRGNLPLESIDLRAAITGLACKVELVQGFRNPHAEALEATYSSRCRTVRRSPHCEWRPATGSSTAS
jgi:hypothetical protein